MATAASPTSFLSSLMANQTAAPGAAQSPTDAVNQFKSQQVAGVLNNQTPIAGQSSTATSSASNEAGKSLALQSLDRQQAALGGADSHARTMALLQQAKANKDAAAAAPAAPQSTSTVVTNNATTGRPSTFTNDNSTDAVRNGVIKDAESYLGTRYVLGGTNRNAIDCSGLVMAVYAKLGFGNLPHNARIQGQIMGQRTSVANLRPGDLVAWNDGSHIAIYKGNGIIIEAANPRVGTVERKLWSNAVYGVRLQLPGE